jgi:Holliday junction resolvase
MSARERAKGARGELEIVHLLHDHGWKNARRTSDGRGQATRGDITNGPAGVHIEVKRVERVNIPAALRQAENDSNTHDIPVVVHRPSRMEWMATLPFNDLLELLELRDA